MLKIKVFTRVVDTVRGQLDVASYPTLKSAAYTQVQLPIRRQINIGEMASLVQDSMWWTDA